MDDMNEHSVSEDSTWQSALTYSWMDFCGISIIYCWNLPQCPHIDIVKNSFQTMGSELIDFIFTLSEDAFHVVFKLQTDKAQLSLTP